MLTPDDAALVHRDPALPGLALLLDPERLRDRLTGLGSDIQAVTTTYLRYKPGISLTAGLRLSTERGESFGYAVAYGEGADDKLAKAARYRRRPSTRAAFRARNGCAFGVLRDCGVVVGSAELDRELPGIAHLSLGRGAHTAERLRPLRYKPARRWVASQGPVDAPRSVVKVHRPRTVARLAGVHQALYAAGAPVADLLGVDDRRGIVRTRWLTGQPLEPGLHGPGAAWSAGNSLARLHRTPSARLHSAGRGDSTAAAVHDWLSRALEGIETVAPELSGKAQDMADRAVGALPADRPACLVHGDFSADQVILRPDGAVIVDLDRARIGDPAVDLANYAANELAARAMTGGELRWTCADVLSGLLDGYRVGGGWPVEDALPALTAAAMLALAVEPFRLREPGWADRLEALLDIAVTSMHSL